MLSAMHELVRHKEVVAKKQKDKKPMDPNMFPIQKLSGELIEEYESVWEVEKESLRNQLERHIGHSLVLKDSSIDHHEAG